MRDSILRNHRKRTACADKLDYNADDILHDIKAYYGLCLDGKVMKPSLLDFRLLFFGRTAKIPPIDDTTLRNYAKENPPIQAYYNAIKELEWRTLRDRADDNIMRPEWAKYRAWNLKLGLESEKTQVITSNTNTNNTVISLEEKKEMLKSVLLELEALDENRPTED